MMSTAQISVQDLEDMSAFALGHYYFERKEWQKSIWAFEDAMLEDDAKDSECLYYRALCKQEMGDLAGAMVDYVIALDRESSLSSEISTRVQQIRDYYKNERGIELPEPKQSVLNTAIRV